MTQWKYTVDISAIFNNDDLELEEKSKLIAQNLRALPNCGEVLEQLLVKLEQQTDVDFFDVIWNRIYDWANVNRVWIKTF